MLLKYTIYIDDDEIDDIEYEDEYLVNQLVSFMGDGTDSVGTYNLWFSIGIF